jgi:hypothetical protein
MIRLQWIVAPVLALGIVAASAESLRVSPDGHKAAAADVAVSARGEIAVLWVDRSPQDEAGGVTDRHVALTDVYVAVSRDGGRSFEPPVKINRDSGSVWGQQVSRPRLVGSPNGSWHVTYAANELHPTIGKTALTTHYTRSTDGGRSFEPPRRVSTLTDQDLGGMLHGGFISAAAFGTIAAAPDGSVRLLWIDTRHMTRESTAAAVYSVVSTDDGRSFAPEANIVVDGVCPCCQLTAAATADSDILVGSRRITAGNIRPATVLRIGHAGGTPGDRISIGGAPWQIEGCPLKPTVVAIQRRQVLAAVHNGAESTPGVIYASSADGGATFRNHGLVHPAASVSDAPSIAAQPGVALLAWHAKTDGPRRVFYRLLALDGSPIGVVRELDAEPGVTQAPVVAARADGRFQIVWQQSDRIMTTVLSGTPPVASESTTAAQGVR